MARFLLPKRGISSPAGFRYSEAVVALFKQDPAVSPVTILCGDSREMLRSLPPKSVQAIVTSFPYLWKRDYGVKPTVWGETRDCCHQWGVPGKFHKGKSAYEPEDIKTGLLCENCSAFLGQFGNEPTPELFVRHCVEVSRELWRVLRDDGVFWLNLANTHANDTKWGGKSGNKNLHSLDGGYQGQRVRRISGAKPKCLIPVVWMVGVALIEDGWILRCDNIWSKTNCVPESQKDRSTISHEYVLQFTKRSKYYWDFKAAEEPVTGNTHSRGTKLSPKAVEPGNGIRFNKSFEAAVRGLTKTRMMRSVWTLPTESFKGLHYATFPRALVGKLLKASTSEVGCCPWCGASWRRMVRKENKEDESRIPKAWDTDKGSHRRQVGRYPGKHGGEVQFGHSAGDSRVVRLSNRTYKGKHGDGGAPSLRHSPEQAASHRMLQNTAKARAEGGEHDNPFVGYETIGWEMTCKCPYATPVPSAVLDPFGGSGTVGLVARDLGRHAILIDLKEEYCALARERLGL